MNQVNRQHTLEKEDNFIWVHFPEHAIIHAETLEIIVKDLMEFYQTDFPLLLDMHGIEGFSVDAFELILELVSNCHQHVAVYSDPNAIGHKYAKLLEMSVHNHNTRAFQNVQAAKSWLTH